MKFTLSTLCFIAVSLSPITEAVAAATFGSHKHELIAAKRRMASPGAASPQARRRRSNNAANFKRGSCRTRPKDAPSWPSAAGRVPDAAASSIVQIQAAAKIDPTTVQPVSSYVAAPKPSSSAPAPAPPAPAPAPPAPAPAPKPPAPAPAPPAPAPAPAPPAPAPAPPAPAPGGGGSFSGVATFYDPGLGACGLTNHDGEYIVAVSMQLFDGFEGYTGGNPNKNPICGRKANVRFGGNSFTVTVTDRCVGCAMYDLDFTSQVFEKLVAGVTQNSNTGVGIGRATGLTWSWA